MTDKFIRDNKVAVLFSPEFGAGWYTWNGSKYGQDLLFHPELVKEVLEKGDVKKVAENLFPEAYLGGVKDLEVKWVQVGQKFRVDEYDGSEQIILIDEDEWITA